MPKEITHIYFSDQTNNKLKEENVNPLFNILSENDSFMHFGSIAVDTFYYSLKLPFEKDYFQWGDLVHGAEGNDTSLGWIEMLDILKSNPNDKYFNQKLSFLCGFLTHCAMDINFHPYVYYFSGNYYDHDKEEEINATMRHRLIESWIDLFILKKLNTKLEDYENINRIFDNKETNMELLKFLAQAYTKIFNVKTDLFKFLKKGYSIQIFFNRNIFNNRSVIDILKTGNDIFDNKLRNYLALCYPPNVNKMPECILEFGSFKHPVTGEEFKGNFDTIWSNALKLSKDFLISVNDYIFNNITKEELKETIKGYSLDVGLIGVKVEDVKYFSPWQLTPVL